MDSISVNGLKFEQSGDSEGQRKPDVFISVHGISNLDITRCLNNKNSYVELFGHEQQRNLPVFSLTINKYLKK